MKLLPDADIAELLVAVRHKVETTPPVTINDVSEHTRDVWRFANDFASEWDTRYSVDATPGYLFEQQLVEESLGAHEMSWRYVQEDAAAWYLLGAFAGRLASRGSEQARNLALLTTAPGAYESMAFLGKWAHYGCQTVEVDEKLAASWCATGLSAAFVEEAQLPWPAFLIRVPSFLAGFKINGEPLLRIAVAADHPFPTIKRIRVTFLTANKFRSIYVSSVGQLAGMKGDEDLVMHNMRDLDATTPAEPSDVRLVWAAGRIVVGIALTVGGDPGVRRYAATPGIKKASLGSPRAGTHPMAGLWKIGRPVKVDVRRAITDWVAGDVGRRPQVRTLVAGHWKRQPVGPMAQQRKWIQVEPYFRGPEDGAMLLRPHKIV